MDAREAREIVALHKRPTANCNCANGTGPDCKLAEGYLEALEGPEVKALREELKAKDALINELRIFKKCLDCVEKDAEIEELKILFRSATDGELKRVGELRELHISTAALVEELNRISSMRIPELSDDQRTRSMQFLGLWTAIKFIAKDALRNHEQPTKPFPGIHFSEDEQSVKGGG